MQSLSWYYARLGAMSSGEILWRVRSAVRNVCDRALSRRTSAPLDLRKVVRSDSGSESWSRGMLGLPHGGKESNSWPVEIGELRAGLLARADHLASRGLELFGRYPCPVGEGTRWNYDYSSDRPTPLVFSSDVDYRDRREVGDAKVVWELSRHQHLLPLARAYRNTGDRKYAELVLSQIRGWVRDCPFGMGMNWRSPLELAIRLINWVWALEFIAPSGLPEREDAELVTGLAYRHLRDIARKYSRYSSANNHLVGEAAGVFIGSSYFANLRQAEHWRRKSYDILCREMLLQTHPDGGHRELAVGYHLFVLEFFLLAGLVGRRTGLEFPAAYWDRLERMFEFVAALLEGGGSLPLFGDADDGYVLDLGTPGTRIQELLAVGAILFQRADFKLAAQHSGETAFWLLGADAPETFSRLGAGTSGRRLVSRAFPQTGYYLLQKGGEEDLDRVSLTFDCGELGFGSIAAHGHADVLGITLRAYGQDILVDPGTYDYFTYADWRDHFRGTAAHNTVRVDGRDQSEMLGPFLWGRRASGRCLAWEVGESRTVVQGEHDGYGQRPISVTHRRSVTLEHASGEVIIQDELSGPGRHTAEMFFHFAERCTVRALTDGAWLIDCGRGEVVLEIETALQFALHHGEESEPLGWISRGYHHRVAAPTLVGSCEWCDSLQITSRIHTGRAGRTPPARRAEALRGSRPSIGAAATGTGGGL